MDLCVGEVGFHIALLMKLRGLREFLLEEEIEIH
jgi:hypothetical protein